LAFWPFAFCLLRSSPLSLFIKALEMVERAATRTNAHQRFGVYIIAMNFYFFSLENERASERASEQKQEKNI
jgi:hypothetical protein